MVVFLRNAAEFVIFASQTEVGIAAMWIIKTQTASKQKKWVEKVRKLNRQRRVALSVGVSEITLTNIVAKRRETVGNIEGRCNRCIKVNLSVVY